MNDFRRDTREEVWIAAGLQRRYRVCSLERTFAEFEDAGRARLFIDLLIEGNPRLKELA